MTARFLSGTLRSVKIAGVSYNVMGEVDVAHIFSQFENSAVVTSGPNMRKMVARAQSIENIDLATDADERLVLAGIADSLADVTLEIVNAANDSYTSSGWIHLDAHQTAESKTTISMFPRKNGSDAWQPTIGQ